MSILENTKTALNEIEALAEGLNFTPYVVRIDAKKVSIQGDYNAELIDFLEGSEDYKEQSWGGFREFSNGTITYTIENK